MILIDHGIEYWIEYTDGSWVQVISSIQADSRLVQSKYYLSRKFEWFKVPPIYSRTLLHHTDSSDIELTTEESARINDLCMFKNVKNSGWYDVIQMHSSL